LDKSGHKFSAPPRLEIRLRILTARGVTAIIGQLRAARRFALGTRGALFPRSPDGNLGGGLFAIVADHRLRRPELLDDVQNSTAALAKEVAPFATRFGEPPIQSANYRLP
jgi:hypothetical protein